MSSVIVILAAALGLSAAPQQASRSEHAVTVTLTEWEIDMPSSLTAGAYVFRVRNNGKRSHTVKIKAEGFKKELPRNLKPGESGELKIDLKPGTYKVTCPIGFGPIGHEKKGMALQLTVTPAQ